MVDKDKVPEIEEERSSFVPFLETVRQFLKLKEYAWALLQNYSFEYEKERSEILQVFKNLLIELSVISPKGIDEVNEKIEKLKVLSRNISVATYPLRENYLSEFKEKLNDVFADIVKLQQEKGLGYTTIKTGEGYFDKLFYIVDFPPYFTLPNGIRIAPELLVFARLLIERTKAAFDNIVIIQGTPGNGKSTLALALDYTLLYLYKSEGIDISFDINTHIITTEPRSKVFKLLGEAPKYSIWDFAEAGNQFSARRSMSLDQNQLVNLINRIRFHGNTIILEWTEAQFLDKQIRSYRGAWKIYVFRLKGGKEGIAILQAPSQIDQPANPEQPIVSTEDKIKFLLSDPATILTFPFYKLPEGMSSDIKKDLKKKVVTSSVKKEKKSLSMPVSFQQTNQPSTTDLIPNI
jgi:hypothetical protein